MAFIEQKYCDVCEKEYAVFTNGKCNKCLDRKVRLAVAAWNALTVEEKLQDIRRRLESLERPKADY